MAVDDNILLEDEELGYTSSSDLVQPKIDTNTQDEEDLPTLRKVQLLIDSQIASYDSVDSLEPLSKDISLTNQILVNQGIKNHLNELKTLVDTTIGDIKEKYDA